MNLPKIAETTFGIAYKTHQGCKSVQNRLKSTSIDLNSVEIAYKTENVDIAYRKI